MKQWLSDLLGLIYPDVCQCCEAPLVTGEAHLCWNCLLELPELRLPDARNSPIHQVFYGRIPLEEAAAMYLFVKGSPIQEVLHTIKYKGNQKLAVHLGGLMGQYFQQQHFFKSVDAVVPVPLHPKKERKRGFNQSLLIAKGMASKLEKELQPQLVFRNTYTDTQTKKSRFARWENVAEVFSCDASSLLGRHILLVDDVLTTGATIEACAQPLLKKGARVSVATLAFVA